MELSTGANLAALLALPGIGEKRAVALAQHFQTWDRLLSAEPSQLTQAVGATTGAKLATCLPDEPWQPRLSPGVNVVSIYDTEYPGSLRNIPNPPTLLWWIGTLPTRPMIAIVGTRTPNRFGASVAHLAATQAARHGIPVCSGLALGVDSIAHSACIDAGLPTWAVLGQGLDTLPKNGDRAVLAARILTTGGGLISEVPPETPVAAHLLTRRNRLQSGLSGAVFIAQTGLATKSKPAGTLHTARFAIEQRRPLAVAEPPATLVNDPDLAGNVALTSPHGADPAILHATEPRTIEMIRKKVPLADSVVASTDDLLPLWERIAESDPRS